MLLHLSFHLSFTLPSAPPSLSACCHILLSAFHKDLAASCVSGMEGCAAVPGGQLGGQMQKGESEGRVQGAARWPGVWGGGGGRQ